MLGPDGLGWLDPRAFGAGRSDLVTLAVVVILFEGALALDLQRLRALQRSLLLLLTVGAALSMAVASLAAWAVLDLSPSVALLYGSLMIVTGPTVVKPLLSRIKLSRSVPVTRRRTMLGIAVRTARVCASTPAASAMAAWLKASWVMGAGLRAFRPGASRSFVAPP